MARAPEDKRVTVDGMSFHYRDWGGIGPPITLFHGLASTCHIWDMVAPILAQDYAVIAVDQRGHGLTEKPDYGYDIGTVTKDALGVIRGLNIENPLVIGHSWGGSVALNMAVEAPELIRGLVWVDGGMINVSNRYPNVEQAKVEMAPPDFTGVKVESFLERVRGRHQETGMSSEVADIVMANFQVLGDNTIKANLSRDNHLRIIEGLWDHKPRELYGKVRCPVLIMPARQQNNLATDERGKRRLMLVEEAEEGLSISKTVWLEDSIHDVPIQKPELVADVIKSHLADGFFG